MATGIQMDESIQLYSHLLRQKAFRWFKIQLSVLPKVRKAQQTLILIRRFRESVLSVLPLDVVKIIAQKVENFAEFFGLDVMGVVACGRNSDSYDDCIATLPPHDCAFVVYRFDRDNQFICLNWYPDTAKIKNKMLYASSKSAVRKQMQCPETLVYGHEIACTDLSECTQEAVEEKVFRK
jgi:cofilin